MTLSEIGMATTLLIAAAWPFWAGRFLPFLDLPQHLALSAVIARYSDAATNFGRFYLVTSHVTPYAGFYAAMHLLTQSGLGVVTAARLLFTLYAIGLPLGAAYLLTALGRDWRWAVFTLPLVYHTNLFWGFAGFLLSLPLFLVALGLACRTLAATRPTWPDSCRLAGAVTLVSLFHAQSYVLLGACVLVLFAVHWHGWRWAARCAAPFTLSLLLFGPWAGRTFITAPVSAATTSDANNGGRPTPSLTRYEPVTAALFAIPERLVGAYNDGSDYRIAAALLVLFLVAVVSGRGSRPQGLRAAVAERRAETLSVLLIASYVVTPIELAGQWYVSPRHLIFAALLAPAWIAGPAAGSRRLIVLLVAVVALWASVNATRKVRAFQDQVGPFADVLDRMQPGKRVMNLIFDRGEHGPVRYWPFLHWGCYYQVEKGGDVSFSFAGVPSTAIAAAQAMPVRYRPGMAPPRPNEWRPWEFRWDAMGTAYDYFLIRGQPVGDATRLADHAELLVRNGDWELWQRRGGDE